MFLGHASSTSGRCPYTTLGVHYGASPDDVRAAFRRAALRTHPDKAGGSAEAFKAVQEAYEALLGGVAAAAVAGWSTTQGSWAAAAAPSTAFDYGTTGTAAQFDPWAAASAPAFDPWSAASFDAAPQLVTADEAVGAAAAGVAPFASSALIGSAAVTEEALAEASAAKKRRRAAKFAKEAKRRRRAGTGGIDSDEGANKLTRFGVYGFRPSSSSDSEADARLQAPLASAPPRPWAGLPGVLLDPSALSAWAGYPNPSATAAMPTTTPTRANSPRRPMAAANGKQFVCFIHKKIRFQSALADDGQGNPVCRSGMECP